jgi:phosphinothricin acetyltransferase
VAERDGRVVGYAKAGTWRARDAYRHTAEAGIYLAPDAVGAGIGRPLYEALLAACDEAGLHTLVAGIALPNERSVRLHEQVGFRFVGVFREVGRKHDAWHDVAFYQRGPR